MNIYQIIVCAVLIAYIGCLLGLSIKLLSLKANLGALPIVPFIPFLAIILAFVHSTRGSEKTVKKNFVKRILNFIWLEFKIMPFMSSIICIVLAKANVSIMSIFAIIFTKGFQYFFKDIKAQSLNIEKNIFNNKKCGFKGIVN